MAELQQTQILPAPFIEAAGKTYLEDLTSAVGGIKGLDLSKLYGPQFVAGQSALQGQAEGLASGLGGYQPFLQAAQAATGPTAYQQYMSPYQQDVIDKTLQEYDIQSQKGLPALAAQAIGAGATGPGGAPCVTNASALLGQISDLLPDLNSTKYKITKT